MSKTEKQPKVAKVKSPKVEKVNDGVERRGRKTNPNSARQQRLARFAEIVAKGGVVKRGRPTVEKTPKVAKVKTEKAPKTEKSVAVAAKKA